MQPIKIKSFSFVLAFTNFKTIVFFSQDISTSEASKKDKKKKKGLRTPSFLKKKKDKKKDKEASK